MTAKPANVGRISWCDLTVTNADSLRDFYQAVTGWSADPVEMDGYQDYCMVPAGHSEPVAGICHSQGFNKNVPSGWLIYITVANLTESIEMAKANGGTVLETRSELAVIRDPSGAHFAIYQASEEPDEKNGDE